MLVLGFALGFGAFLWWVLHPLCPECHQRFSVITYATRDVIKCPHCGYWEAR